MGILSLFIVIIVGVSLLPFILKKILSTSTPHKVVKRFLYFFAVLLFFILISELILNNFNLYYRGYKTRTFILLVTSLLFCVSYAVTEFKNKLYQAFASLLIFVSLFVSISICAINLIGFSDNLLFENDKYRIESFRFIKSRADYLPDVYVKKGLFENKYRLNYLENYQFDYLHTLYKNEIKEYNIREISEDSIVVNFVFNDDYSLNTFFLPTD